MKDLLMHIVQLEPGSIDRDSQEQLDLLTKKHIRLPFIMVSLNTAGRVAGGEKTMQAVHAYLAERKLKAQVVEMGHLGISGEEPIVSIQMPGRTRVYFRRVTPARVPHILDDVFHNTIPEEFVIGQLKETDQDAWPDIPFFDDIPFFKLQNRIVLKDCGIIDPLSIEEYIARGGYRAFLKTISNYTFEEACGIIEDSGLRGRSGSGFPTGTKLKVALQSPSDQKYLVCNAEESDPGAFMDRTIMEGTPHQLIEGICIASYAIGATKAYIYIRTEYTDSIRKLERALTQAREFGFLGHNVFQSGFNLDITIRKGPGAFVCGEETALIASLEGRRGMPQTKPPFPATRGYRGKPTIINNVETLANIPLIMAHGSEWFQKIGRPACPGTKIFSVSGRSRMGGLIEVAMGTTLNYIVNEIAGGVKKGKQLKGIHIGGPSGCLVPAHLMDTPVCYESLKEQGLVMGAGGILVLDEQVCIVDLARYFMDFANKQSCGKCIPCREGTKRMSEILENICRKQSEEADHDTLERFKGVMQMQSLAGVMKDTSLCGLGRDASNPVMSSLKHFRSEYEEHIFNRNCPSNTCTELRSYYIDVDFCTGCSICEKRCPAEAIVGTRKHPYFIVQEKCIGCGICMEVCKFSAVFYK